MTKAITPDDLYQLLGGYEDRLNRLEQAVTTATTGTAITNISLRGTRAARPAANSVITGTLYYASDNGITYQSDNAANTWTAIMWQALRVVTLPTVPAPEDGQLIDYVADATNGVLWPFRYNAGSGSAHKWEARGSSVLLARDDANDDNFTVVAAYGPFAHNLQITAPLAGDYEVGIGANIYAATATSSTIRLSFATGATAAIDNDSVAISGASPAQSSVAGFRTKNNLGAGTVLQLQGRIGTAGADGHYRWKWISIRPIRVG